MRTIYIFLLIPLLWSFWKAMTRLRWRYAAFSPILGWIVGLGFFILTPLTVIVLNGGYQIPAFYEVNDSYATVDLSNVRYLIPFLVIWACLLFSFLVVVFCAPNPGERQETPEIALDEFKLKRAVKITASLAVVDYITTIRLVGGVQEFLLSHWYTRQIDLVGRLGDAYVLYIWLSQSNQILFTASATLYVYFAIKHQRLNWKFSVFVLFFFLLQIGMLGNRIFFALFLLAFVISCWILRRKRLMVIFLLIFAPVLALVLSAWAYFRHDLTTIGENVPTYVEGDIRNRAVTSVMDAFEGNDTMVLFHIVNDFGSSHPYLYGSSYARLLFFWIPRSLYPEKPAGFAGQIAALYEPGELTSMNATALGEMYANFGFLSLLALPLFTLGVLYFDEWLIRKGKGSSILLVASFLIFIWLARSSFVDNIMTLFFVTILIRVLNLEKGSYRQSSDSRVGLALPQLRPEL